MHLHLLPLVLDPRTRLRKVDNFGIQSLRHPRPLATLRHHSLALDLDDIGTVVFRRHPALILRNERLVTTHPRGFNLAVFAKMPEPPTLCLLTMPGTFQSVSAHSGESLSPVLDLAGSLIVEFAHLRAKSVRADAPRGAQNMRVMIAVSLPFERLVVWRMNRHIHDHPMAFNQGCGELTHQRLTLFG